MSSPIDFLLRQSRPDEGLPLFSIHRAAFAALVEQMGGLDEEIWRKGFLADFHSEDVLIVEIDGETAGWIHTKRDTNEWFLKEIVVAPARQGCGLGTALMDKMMEQARQAGAALTLSVYRVNRSLSLYQRLGFMPYASDPMRIWMVHDPERRARLDVRLLRALMRRASRHALRLKNGVECIGQILAVDGERVELLADSGAEPLDLDVHTIDLQSLRYDEDGWVSIRSESESA